MIGFAESGHVIRAAEGIEIRSGCTYCKSGCELSQRVTTRDFDATCDTLPLLQSTEPAGGMTSRLGMVGAEAEAVFAAVNERSGSVR
jgi:hypothetical protein